MEATARQNDPWARWRRALATPMKERSAGDGNDPDQGYYRDWWKGKLEPVAYWYDTEGLHCLVGNNIDKPGWYDDDYDTHLKIARERWTYACNSQSAKKCTMPSSQARDGQTSTRWLPSKSRRR